MRFRIPLTFLFLFAFQLSLNAQDCECEDETITLCYLSEFEYCISNNGQTGGNCGFTFDGNWMENSIVPKLTNALNFGPDGIVTCALDIIQLQAPNTVQAIEAQFCDIIFTGAFAIVSISGTTDFTQTAVPPNQISAIKSWSEKCISNLVITTQTEASIWGYEVLDGNINPNTPISANSIFDGPFGTITQFEQGGGFQGVFEGGPPSGFEPLAVDFNGSITVLLDFATNDIILGDIGIFCGGAAGAVSDGPFVNNNNDILVTNIFALGCDIANNAIMTDQIFSICNGQNILLPDGDIVGIPGIYIDTLVASNDCDSIITTIISEVDTLKNFINIEACQGDGTSIIVDNNTYDETNPTGFELLTTPDGCDSLVTIDIQFRAHSSFDIQESHCFEENYVLQIENEIFDRDNPTGTVNLTNAVGCDSVVTVVLDFSDPIPNINLPTNLEINFGETYPLDLGLSNEYSVQWFPAEAVSCENCSITELIIKEDIATLMLELTDPIGCIKSYEVDISINCPVYLPNVFLPSSINTLNSSFTIGHLCPLDSYQLNIYDRWGGLIFTSTDETIIWDGKIDDQRAVPGIYLFDIIYSAFGTEYTDVGQLTLIR